MNDLLVSVVGVVVGIAAATPILFELGREEPDVGRGVAAVARSFLAIQALMVMLLVWRRNLVFAFGVSATLAFLGCLVTCAVLKALENPNDHEEQ